MPRLRGLGAASPCRRLLGCPAAPQQNLVTPAALLRRAAGRRSRSLSHPTSGTEEKVLERDRLCFLSLQVLTGTSGLCGQDGRLLCPHPPTVPMLTQTHVFPHTGFTAWTGVPCPLFSTSYLTLCISFHMTNVPPALPPCPHCWQGLHPAQKLSTGASVTVSIKTNLLCALTRKADWKNKVRKSPTLPLSRSK